MNTIDNMVLNFTNNFYSDQKFFNSEYFKIYSKNWICVGTIDDFANINDFIVFKYSNFELIIQNFNGTIKAFKNVCSHRFSRIHVLKKGNRRLICPYHGWTYDDNGVPKGVAFNQRCFNLSDNDKSRLALDKFEVGICGIFVFVNLGGLNISLADFLGKYYDVLIHVSKYAFLKFDNVSEDWMANWKLVIENALEGYHLPLVHKDSFAEVLTLDLKFDCALKHSSYIGLLTEKSKKWWKTIDKIFGLDRSSIYSEYLSAFIYPNLIITFSYGCFLTVQIVEPINLTHTLLNTNVFISRSKNNVSDLVFNSLKDFGALVRSEDKEICEIVQSGSLDFTANKYKHQVLGSLEDRIVHFQKQYLVDMEL